MRPIATNVARSVVCVSVCWSTGVLVCCAKKGWTDRSRCHLGGGWLMWVQGTMYYMRVHIPTKSDGDGAFFHITLESCLIHRPLQGVVLAPFPFLPSARVFSYKTHTIANNRHIMLRPLSSTRTAYAAAAASLPPLQQITWPVNLLEKVILHRKLRPVLQYLAN